MKEAIKVLGGDVAASLFPTVTQSIAEGNTVPRGIVAKLISSNLIRKAAQSGDHESLRNQLSKYWQGSAGDVFYESFADRFETSFLGEHYEVVKALSVLIESYGEYSQLFEIGCGDGQVINHLSEKLHGIQKFVGLDINERIIRKNRRRWKNSDVSFEAGDAAEKIRVHAEPGTVVMSYGGVMEYFLEAELLEMFKMLKQKSPVAVALVEPLYDGFDLETEITSRPSGMEHSFSHNHRHLLESAGFEIEFQQEIEGEFRWMMIVAKG